ncbi:MAG: PhnA domain-containing protein [Flavobacteriales bacterium]|nr:PhnA domain-containing protein [Flavobacteriales bacterium]
MSLEKDLQGRANNACELCSSTNALSAYAVPPHGGNGLSDAILVCETCKSQIEKRAELDSAHWQCLNTSMWSEVPAVQVVAWRMLNRLKNDTWASDALDMMYLADEHLEWAKESNDHLDTGGADFHRDVNGQILQNGDTVVLVKMLDVKGSSLSLKVGTVVKNIRLVADNTEHIEGRVENQQVVIITKYLKKG